MTFFTNFDKHYNGKTFADVLTSIKSKEADVKAKLKSAVEDTSGNGDGNDDEVNLLYAEIDKQLTAKATNPFSAANVESIGTDTDFLKLNLTKAKKNLGKRPAATATPVLSSPESQVEKALYLLNSNEKDEFVPFDGAPAAVPTPAPTPPPAANTKPTVTATTNTALTATDRNTRTLILGEANLNATDPETTIPAELTYTFKKADGGEVFNNDVQIQADETFTQQDIKDGKIKFVWNGSTPSGVGFDFVLKDKGNLEADTKRFEVTVTPPTAPTPATSAPPAATATKPIIPTSEIQINGQETIQVQPNTANDTEIGTLTVPGADVKSYELKDTSGKFKIEGDKLKVKDGSLIVPPNTISLVIKATDKETPANTLEKTITVSIPAASVPPTPANPAPSVAAKTAEIKKLQQLLTDRGFYNGTIDGVMSQTTRDAILAAQKAYGLTADGIAGAQTIAALETGTSTARVNITVTGTTTTNNSQQIPPLTVRSDIPDSNRAVIIQSALRKTGDYNGLVTGEWDSASNEAYTKWETKNPGQDINTILPRGTRSVSGKLFGSWSSGADVKTVQTFLNTKKSELGIEALAVDGAYGPQTEAAVRALQTKYNEGKTNDSDKIKEDGILGPETELAINSKYDTNLFNVT